MLPVAILAGGLATRLGSLTEKIPKSLIPIDGEPFVAHQLRLLERNGIQHVILWVGPLGGQMGRTVGEGGGLGGGVPSPTTAPCCWGRLELSGPHFLSWKRV